MSSAVMVDLFVEDRAHEQFLKPLVTRIAREEGIGLDLSVRSARGGHGRAIQEFELYQDLVAKGQLSSPDIVVVGIDGNCAKFAEKRAEIQQAKASSLSAGLVIACPDPHVERWYLADPGSFDTVVGYRPSVGRKKCRRDHYKGLLGDAVRSGGHPPTLGGVEFAAELVEAMDLYRAGRNDHSLRAFVGDLRGKLREADGE